METRAVRRGDARWMRLALALATGGRGRVEPNPLVGCLLVKDGIEIGRGVHRRWGGAHAEAEALAAAGDRARDATAFVTLEPCALSGKTPPCADALIAAGIVRVVYAADDPDARTTGRGPARLRKSGIDVAAGLLADEAEALNVRFARHLERSRPWTILKWGASLDGRLGDAAGHSGFVTGPASRRIVHRIRASADAIAIGIGTLLADDPSLTCRGVPGVSPHRIVFDSKLRAPLESTVVRTSAEVATTIVHGEAADPSHAEALVAAGVSLIAVRLADDGSLDLLDAFARLRERGIERMLLEGGPTIASAALRGGLIDHVMAFSTGSILGGDGAPAILAGPGISTVDHPLRLVDVTRNRHGDDLLVEGFLANCRSHPLASTNAVDRQFAS